LIVTCGGYYLVYCFFICEILMTIMSEQKLVSIKTWKQFLKKSNQK